jgi:hypothetical protein
MQNEKITYLIYWLGIIKKRIKFKMLWRGKCSGIPVLFGLKLLTL